jgi:hypothetical protein
MLGSRLSTLPPAESFRIVLRLVVLNFVSFSAVKLIFYLPGPLPHLFFIVLILTLVITTCI